jgi:hypothetical protein
MKSIIIHKVTNGSGGLGDFIRASLSFYTFCKKNNVKYYIDFSGFKFLSECFELRQITQNILNLPFENISFMNIIGEINSEKLNDIITKPKIYNLISNTIGFQKSEDINKYIDKFFDKILKPSNHVLNYINDIYNKLKIEENKYISLHVRCGDKIMCMNNNDNPKKTHMLIDINEEKIYDNYKKYINDFNKKYNKMNYPIILHSDSQIFKNKMKKNISELIIIDNEIRHNSENIGINTLESNIQTVAELYIIAKSHCIFTYTYSGFSHMASLIYKKNIYTNYSHHGYYTYINRENIFGL